MSWRSAGNHKFVLQGLIVAVIHAEKHLLRRSADGFLAVMTSQGLPDLLCSLLLALLGSSVSYGLIHLDLHILSLRIGRQQGRLALQGKNCSTDVSSAAIKCHTSLKLSHARMCVRPMQLSLQLVSRQR